MKTPLRTKLTAVLCLAYGTATLSSLHSSVASAAQEGLPTRIVKFGDLDLSKAAGVKTLYRRIQSAARQVCQLDTVSDVHMMAKEQQCMKRAIDDAVNNVNSPALSNLRFGASPRLASR